MLLGRRARLIVVLRVDVALDDEVLVDTGLVAAANGVRALLGRHAFSVLLLLTHHGERLLNAVDLGDLLLRCDFLDASGVAYLHEKLLAALFLLVLDLPEAILGSLQLSRVLLAFSQLLVLDIVCVLVLIIGLADAVGHGWLVYLRLV